MNYFTTISKQKEKHILYKGGIVLYALYLTFSSHVFALQAEAPERMEVQGEELGALVAPDFSLRELEEREALEQERREREEKVLKIKKYFNRYHLPLAQQASIFVEKAEKYGIDWRLVAAIGFIESTGGKFSCGEGTYNAFGWASCKQTFSSYEESIDYISKNLAGKNPNTRMHYYGKDIRGILEAYNPPSVVPDYADKVMREMEIIAKM